jgi:hypothetical protein
MGKLRNYCRNTRRAAGDPDRIADRGAMVVKALGPVGFVEPKPWLLYWQTCQF